MDCPRCSEELEFIRCGRLDDGIMEYEYLCTRCFLWVQELFEMTNLVCTITGEL